MNYPVHDVFYAAIMGYFLGSLPAGVIAGKIKGVDLRKEGSGNIGFTNAYRVLGKDWSGKLLSVMVLLWDMGKGLLATMLAASFLKPHEAVAYAALFSVLGHLYPVWLKFHGGKGVAVGFGAILGVCPPLGLILIVVWVILLSRSRENSVRKPFRREARWIRIGEDSVCEILIAASRCPELRAPHSRSITF